MRYKFGPMDVLCDDFQPRLGMEQALQIIVERVKTKLPYGADCNVKVKGAEGGFIIAIHIVHDSNAYGRKIYMDKHNAIGLDRHWITSVIDKLIEESLFDMHQSRIAI